MVKHALFREGECVWVIGLHYCDNIFNKVDINMYPALVGALRSISDPDTAQQGLTMYRVTGPYIASHPA